MLANVVGSYLDGLQEREFDAPFMALLRALGFRDIHLLHGPFEFGKDFIAKGEQEGRVVQFAFQTKAGDIGLSNWHGCRGQIDLLRTNSLAHPDFDRALPRQAVFVTTGRLVGGAALAAQEYGEHLQQLGEIGFAIWGGCSGKQAPSSRPSGPSMLRRPLFSGLAGPHSAPEEELAYLLGSPFEHIVLQRRSASYTATVILDIAAMLEMKELFELAINDFLAVHAMLSIIEVNDTPGQYVLSAEDTRSEPNMQYSTIWASVEGWKVAPHHKRGPAAYYLEREGRAWDHLAVTAVLRDRHFLPTCRSLLAAP